MATKAGDIQLDHEAWLKHTAGGEMPDASILGRNRRRALAATSILKAEFRSAGTTWVPLALTVVVLGLGAYFLWERFANVPEDYLDAA